MIQILGLRTFKDKETGQIKRYDAFFDKNWRASSLPELFKNIDTYLSLIPQEERWNIFYTVANCNEEKRKFLYQEVLPIDIDGILEGTEDQVTQVILDELGLSKDKVGITYSGHGVHILIGMKEQMTEASQFRSLKVYYKALAGRVNQALFNAGVAGKTDTTVFSESRILRLPLTENRKDGLSPKMAKLINANIEYLDVTLPQLAQLPEVGLEDQIHPKVLAKFPKPDTEAVINGCGFLQHCRDTDEKVPEPMWYAMLSITGRLEDGVELSKAFSIPKGNKHDKYTHLGYHPNVEAKLTHALESAGPRTCENISEMYEGCRSCPHFGKVKSPILIVGKDTIRTAESGFYTVVIDKDGLPKKGKPNYDDLVKQFKKDHDYVTISSTRQLFVWNETHWREMNPAEVHSYAEKKFDPTPTNSMCSEFESKLKRTNLRDDNFTVETKALNFKNGVLLLATGELVPHSKDYGFTYVIPYDYEPDDSGTPMFDKFLSEVACGDDALTALITEYMGYCISGEDPVLVQKCAILYGDGSNGKSVLLSILRELVGRDNSTSISISSMKKENYRYAMMHKMFNACDETPSDGFLDSSIFKQMVAGDEIEVRRLYQDPIMWKCTTKLIFNCNELPVMKDFSYGMKRRLLIIPFRATFSDEKGNKDPMILDKILNSEKSNIFKKCLDAFREVKEKRYAFTMPSVVVEEVEEYTNSSDHVVRFVQTCCLNDGRITQPLTIEIIYASFVDWCRTNNVNPLSYGNFSRRFGKRVEMLMPDVQKSRPRGMNGARTVAYKGLKIITQTEMSASF